MKKYLLLLFYLTGFFQSTKSQTILTIGQVYDFNIDDEFQYCHYDNEFYYHFPNATRCKVIDKYYSDLNDTVFYLCHFNNYRSKYNPVPYPHMDYFLESYTDTLYYTNLDTLINAQFQNWPIDTSAERPTDTLYYSSQMCNRLVYKYTRYTGSAFEGCSYEYEFGQGLGMVEAVYQCPAGPEGDFENYLTYYKKGSIECGTYDSTAMSIMESVNPNDRIVIYPNPASTEIHIKVRFSKSNRISIFNTTGNMILSSAVYKNNVTIDISLIPDGLYFILVENDSRNYYSKFIKQ